MWQLKRFAITVAFLSSAAWAQEPEPLPVPAPEPAPAAEPAPTPPKKPIVIDIDLSKQRACLIFDGHVMYESPISSGRAGHLTPTGDFSVLEKDLNHKSTLYGQIVNANGGIVVSGADSAMPVPKGCKFVAAPMKYFLRFEGASGMHAGYLPGYAASHGCVRMPAAKARLFYNTAEIGTPVRVHGRPPARAEPVVREKFFVTAAPTPEPRRGFRFPWLR